jgi:Mg2+ and Co2+ transporter CorA
VTAIIIDAAGVRLAGDAAEVAKVVAAGGFFWLDIFGGDASTRALLLAGAGLDSADIGWAVRFGQAGRMLIGQAKVRAATWVGDRAGNLIELHLIGRQKCLVTVWSGDAAELDDIRRQFAERVAGFDDSLYEAAGILLQLLLGTLQSVVESLDAKLDGLRLCTEGRMEPADFPALTRRLQALQSSVASFGRYSSAVRSATVGIETLPGMDDRGAQELNDYVEQVEDVEEQFHERRRWMSDLRHDFATSIAQKQGEQINRLTLVSLIFLPVTALTGFFGMNFDWMNQEIGGAAPFFTLGVALPALCVILTMVWLARRGLLRLRFWPARITTPTQREDEAGREAQGGISAAAISRAEMGFAQRPQESSKA